jgi:putative membrane protein
MANERTFLAWIRTSIGIMAFGFVVEKFALFVKQMALFYNMPDKTVQESPSFSAVAGFALILLGAITTLLAFIKFRITSRRIDNESYRPLFLFDLFLTMAVLAVAIFLIVYLFPFK